MHRILEVLWQHGGLAVHSFQSGRSGVPRAGCSSAAVPPACLARGTSCPVYFQGVAMKPDRLRGTGILLHNKLAGSRPACYTLIW
jgi:hypothetical protein